MEVMNILISFSKGCGATAVQCFWNNDRPFDTDWDCTLFLEEVEYFCELESVTKPPQVLVDMHQGWKKAGKHPCLWAELQEQLRHAQPFNL